MEDERAGGGQLRDLLKVAFPGEGDHGRLGTLFGTGLANQRGCSGTTWNRAENWGGSR